MSSSADYYTSAEPPASQQIATALIGPPFVGWCVQFILFGALASNFSAYIQTKNYRDDSRANRVFVWVVVALTTAYTGLCAWLACYHGVSQDRSIDALYLETVPGQSALVRACEGVRPQPRTHTKLTELWLPNSQMRSCRS